MLQNVDLHDASYFRLSRTEASALDPQGRLLLETAAEALVAAGTRFGAAAARRTGTFVGCMFTEYMPLLRQGYGLHHTGAVMTGAPTSHMQDSPESVKQQGTGWRSGLADTIADCVRCRWC